MNLRKSLIAFFILSHLTLLGQYKRVSVGVGYSTNNFTNNFSSYGLNTQYNFKKIFSISTGLNYDCSTFNFSYDFASLSPFRTITTNYHPRYLSVPILLKASVGKKVLFFANIGVNYIQSLKNWYETFVDYHDVTITDYQIKEYGFIGKIKDVESVFGFGITTPIVKNIILTFDTKKTMMLNRNDSYPTDGLDLYKCHSFYGMKFTLSLAYQFNFSKNNDYNFNPAHIKASIF